MSNQQIPDIGVRLSAEGVSDVVRAFQQVSAAAKQSGKDSSKGFGVLNSALDGLAGLLPTLGFAAAATGLAEMVKSTLDGAVAIEQLAQKTGLSVEALSTLKVAATETDTDFDTVSQGLIRFNKAQGDLQNGGKLATTAVKSLFGSVTALNGLNTDQRFEKVATAIGKLPAGFQKTSDAIAFFGKSGADLIPLMNTIATKGFDQMTQEASKFGLLMGGDTVKQMKEASDALTILKLEAQGAATQFTAGLAPAVGNTVSAITTGLASDGVSGMEKLGEGVGTVIKVIALLGTSIGTLIGGGAAIAEEVFDELKDQAITKFQQMVTAAKATGTAIGQSLQGNIFGAAATLAAGQTTVDQMDADLTKRSKQRNATAQAESHAVADQIKATYEALFNAPAIKTAGANGAGGGTGTPGATQFGPEATKALIALQQQQLDARLALDKQYDAIFAAQDKQEYSQGLLSLKQYFDDRTAAIDQEADSEIAALQKQRATLASTPLPVANNATADQIQAAAIKRKQELAAIDDKITATQAGRLAQQSQNDIERANAQQDLALKQLDLLEQIKTAEGDTYGAALIAIQKQNIELGKSQLNPDLVKQLDDLQAAAARFAEFAKQGQQALTALGDVQTGLQNQADAGKLFPFQAVQQYDAAVNAALPHLRDLAAAQTAAAVTDAEKASALQFSQNIDKLSISADQGAQRMGEFKKSLEEGLTSDLATFFSTGIDQAASFGDAVREMAVSVVESLQQIVAQMLATIIVQKLLTAATGVGTATSVVGAGAALLGGKFADGGPVVGPGTGTSDSIPARLSHGEFVVRASSVRQPGVLSLLAAINRGMGTPSLRSLGTPHFASGGLVQGTAQGSPADGADDRLTVGLEDGLVVRHMSTPSGRRVMLKQVASNPKAFRAALGI